jgi:hypothetical protein
MKRTHQPRSSLAAAQQAFQAVAVAVSGIYIGTHSVAVTLIGTTAATVVAGWAAGPLGRHRESRTQPLAAKRERTALRDSAHAGHDHFRSDPSSPA